VENQVQANLRIPVLLSTPAPVRFVSIEPMLSPVDLSELTLGDHVFNALECDVAATDDGEFKGATLDWVICGGESGTSARPMAPDWAEALHDQCKSADLPFFMKQMSGKTRAERECIPDHINCRQFPGERQ